MNEPLRSLIIVFAVLAGAMSLSAGLIWLERRLLGLWQDRYGPNRVGPFGMLQVMADFIKIFFKEDWIPAFADRPSSPKAVPRAGFEPARGKNPHQALNLTRLPVPPPRPAIAYYTC